MLILGRKHGQAIVVSRDGKPVCRIVLMPRQGHGYERIGVEADAEYRIMREEIAEQQYEERNRKP